MIAARPSPLARVLALEAQNARKRSFTLATRIAEQDGIDVADMWREAERIAERSASIGFDATVNELALDAGITPDDLRAEAQVIGGRYHAEL